MPHKDQNIYKNINPYLIFLYGYQNSNVQEIYSSNTKLVTCYFKIMFGLFLSMHIYKHIYIQKRHISSVDFLMFIIN